MSSNTQYTPLIDIAEGRDFENRSDLMAAFLARSEQLGRKSIDRTSQQLLCAIFAVGKTHGRVHWTYAEIAERHLCSPSSARRAVSRLEELDLIEKETCEYARGGQGANYYNVKKPDSLLLHSEVEQPGVQNEQPGVQNEQPGVQNEQPYKEGSSISSSIKASTHSLTGEPDEWKVVVSDLFALGMAAAEKAVDSAQRRGLTIEKVRELVALWQRLKARQTSATVAYLYRWLTGQSRPPGDPDEPVKGHSLMDDSTVAEKLRSQLWREGKEKGLGEDVIKRVVQNALQKRGLTPKETMGV